MDELYMKFSINVYNDGGEDETFRQRADAWIKELRELCTKYELYYGGTSSFRLIAEPDWAKEPVRMHLSE